MPNTRGNPEWDVILQVTGPARWFDVPHRKPFRGSRPTPSKRHNDREITQEEEPITLTLGFSTPPLNGTPWFWVGRDQNADIRIDSTSAVSGCHLSVGFDEWDQIVIRDTSMFDSEIVYTQMAHAYSTRTPKPQQHKISGNQTDPPHWVVPVGWTVSVIFSEGSAEIVFQVPDHSRHMDEYQRMVREFRGYQYNPLPFLGGLPLHGRPIITGAVLPSAERSASENKEGRYVWIVGDKKLGGGSDGQVFEVFRSSDWARCAGKRVQDHEKFQVEYASLSTLEHKHIARYIDIQEMQGSEHMIIMEYCSLGSLDKQRRLPRFNEGEIIEIMTQAFSAVAYLHSNNITHRDIKPANILIRSREPLEIAVSDFGSSKLGQFPMETFIGTYYYMAPEVLLLGEPSDESGPNGRYNNKSDIWSLGVTAVQLIHGRLPMLKDQGDFDMRYPSAMNKSCDMFLASFRNRSFARLVSEMLSWDPKDRPTAADCFYRASISSGGNGAGAWGRSYGPAFGAGVLDSRSSIRPVKRQTSDLNSSVMPPAKMPAIAVDPASGGSTPAFSGLLEGAIYETDVHRNIPETECPGDLWTDESEDFSDDGSSAGDSERSGETEDYN